MPSLPDRTPVPGQGPATRQVLLDAHVHCHPGFALHEFLDHAQRNLDRIALGLGSPGDAAALLVLTEASGEHSFARFLSARGGTLPGGWRIGATAEPESLIARPEHGLTLTLIAGQQVRLHERLELLAIAGNPALPDGGTLDETAAEILRAGAVPVLPWGFGKWSLGRRRLVERLLDRASPDELLLADSGTRAALAPFPRLLARGARRGFRVIAGSDPLPLAGEVARPGSVGCLLEGPFSTDTPASALRELLLRTGQSPQLFGTGRPLPAFLRDQIVMQLRKAGGWA